METIATKNAPAAIGPYSQGKKIDASGKLIFTSGQIPVNPENGKIEATDIKGQTEQACKNVAAVLKAAGADMENVVKTVCFLSDIADFAAFNEVYAKYFVSSPARSCVAVKDIPKGCLVEIEAIAQI